MRSTSRRRSAGSPEPPGYDRGMRTRKLRVALRWRRPRPRTDTTHYPIWRYQLQRRSRPIGIEYPCPLRPPLSCGNSRSRAVRNDRTRAVLLRRRTRADSVTSRGRSRTSAPCPTRAAWPNLSACYTAVASPVLVGEASRITRAFTWRSASTSSGTYVGSAAKAACDTAREFYSGLTTASVPRLGVPGRAA